MKLQRTLIFAVLTTLTVSIVYVFDFKATEKRAEEEKALILNYNPDHISYIQVVKSDHKIGLQKSDGGWSLLEPIQDFADNNNIEDMLKQVSEERQLAVVLKAETELKPDELREFGLDRPEAIFNFKNNLGHSKKIAVGSVKNYEGNSYLRVDADNRVLLASATWANYAKNEMIFYREKNLFRGRVAEIQRIQVKSLSDNFEIRKNGNQWESADDQLPVDQNKVRELLKSISETKIENYIFEGEPSVKSLQEKGLDPVKAIHVELHSEESNWAITVNLHTQDRLVYALTERPTFLVSLNPDAWEMFGNLRLDSLRDRSSALAFNPKEVTQLYYKKDGDERNFELKDGKWSQPEAAAVVEKLNNLKIAEFLPASAKSAFKGDNILILKSAANTLVLQLNWGPSFSEKKGGVKKDYYYARTHLSGIIFSLDKEAVDALHFSKTGATGE